MKAEEFLKRLRKTPRKWHLEPRDGNREIRCDLGLCPIEAVGKTGQYTAVRAGVQLGLSEDLTCKIMDAADDETHGIWRRRLLEACGLSK